MRILVADPTFPHPDENSAGVRLFEIVRILLRHGHRMTFLARHDKTQKYREALEALGAECVSDSEDCLSGRTAEFRLFLEQRGFDVAIMSYYDIYNFYAPFIRAFLPRCRLILDTVDLHFLRLQREIALTSDPCVHQEAEEARRKETVAILHADNVWVVTELERQKIHRDVSDSVRVHVVPNIHSVEKNIQGYSERGGILFLGAYRHRPNVDAVRYFMNEVFPILRIILPKVHLTVAGGHPPCEFRNYQQADPHVIISGHVKDHRALLGSHLVGIAPLRYGAGMKGKIGEYLACGLPCVTSSIGAEGMDLRHGYDVLIADDPARFARAIVRLYRDPRLWQSLSQAGVEYIKNRLSPEVIAPIVLDAVCSSGGTFRQTPRIPLTQFLERVSNPRKLRRLASSAILALRNGGLAELQFRVKLWASRP